MELNLDNKKVLITGASRGIGLSIAEGFLKENAMTCIVSRGSDDLYKSEKKLHDIYGLENSFAFKCDCTDLNSLNNLKYKILEKWNCLDILIVNVGDQPAVCHNRTCDFTYTEPTGEITAATYDKTSKKLVITGTSLPGK